MNPHRFKRFAWVALWLSIVAIVFAWQVSISPVDAVAYVLAVVGHAAFVFWISSQLRVYWRWYRLKHHRDRKP